jgi:hypothetical protein
LTCGQPPATIGRVIHIRRGRIELTAPVPAAADDKTTLWGVLGIVGAFCCLPLGVVFAILSMNEAKKYGKQPTLAYVGLGLAALFLVINIALLATGNFFIGN